MAAAITIDVDEAAELRTLQRLQRSRRRRTWVSIFIVRLVLFGAFLVTWERASGSLIDEFWISKPSEVADRLWEWTRDGTIWSNSIATLRAALFGFILGSAAGVALGIAFGLSSWLERLFDPFVTAMYSLPKIAVAPLFILWFGIDTQAKVLFAAMIVFFLVFYPTQAGVRSVDRDLIDVLRVLSATRLDLIRKAILPSTATWIFAGLRQAVPYALVGAVVSELIASSEGLGWLLGRSSGTFDTTGTFAALTVLLAVAVVVNGIVRRVERRSSRWRQVEERTEISRGGSVV